MGVNKREATDIVDTFFEITTEKLGGGEDVRLSDFMAVQMRTKGSRPGRTPRTGESLEIRKQRVVTFQFGPKLKGRLKIAARHTGTWLDLASISVLKFSETICKATSWQGLHP